MRVCIVKSTGALIEAQSGDGVTPGALVANAVAAGYKKTAVVEKVINDDAFKVLLNAAGEPKRQARIDRITALRAKADVVRVKLGLTPGEFEDLVIFVRERNG